MHIELEHVPFSRRASYFAVSRLTNRPQCDDGLYLRTVHGGAKTRELFSLNLTSARGREQFHELTVPGKLSLSSESGVVELCLDSADRVLVRGQGVSLELDALLTSAYDLIVPLGHGRWQYICYASDINLMITVRQGTLRVTDRWTGVKSEQLRLRLDPDPITNRSLLSLEEFTTSYQVERDVENFDQAVEVARLDFLESLSSAPQVQSPLAETRELAVYVNWASIVAPRGHIQRPVMFMSKNWMTNVWAWDHCFNAMASTGDLKLAMDQFLCIFDYQDEHGGIPDCFNDSFISRNFTKPAVHGWALQWMMDRTEFDESFLSASYAALSKWTEWWFEFRDVSGGGFPAYYHGNDSGWDNGTAFARFVPVESPDQIAFLIIQLEVLSGLAGRLGQLAEADAWMARSTALLENFLREFWVDGRFVARSAVTHEVVHCDSLLMYVPLVLGARLPAEIFATLANGLTSNGFLTEFGLATESPSSAFYTPDGYWRGPIWAPSTLIIVDGLKRGGRADLAEEIARRFCLLASRSGMAENYDAVSGEGLRDRAYTWTASVFLILASEYVASPE